MVISSNAHVGAGIPYPKVGGSRLSLSATAITPCFESRVNDTSVASLTSIDSGSVKNLKFKDVYRYSRNFATTSFTSGISLLLCGSGAVRTKWTLSLVIGLFTSLTPRNPWKENLGRLPGLSVMIMVASRVPVAATLPAIQTCFSYGLMGVGCSVTLRF
jgi:hypothetical protein